MHTYLFDFGINNDSYRFAFHVMSLIQPYFKHDWLMSRAFVLLCPYKDMFIYVRDYPEMVPLICWKVGCICLDEIAFKKNDEVINILIQFLFIIF